MVYKQLWQLWLIFSTWVRLHGSISTFLNTWLTNYTLSLMKLVSKSAGISLWISTTHLWNRNTCGYSGKKWINFLSWHRLIGFQKRWALSTEIDFLVLHYVNKNAVGLLVNEVNLPVPMLILALLLLEISLRVFTSWKQMWLSFEATSCWNNISSRRSQRRAGGYKIVYGGLRYSKLNLII